MSFDDEPPTKPERPVPCPECQGTGKVLRRIETATTHRAFPDNCPMCKGKRLVSYATIERFRNSPTARPPTRPSIPIPPLPKKK